MSAIDPAFTTILLATTARVVVGVTVAFYSVTLLPKVAERSLSLSVGIMLSTSLMHALPEALDSRIDPHHVFGTVLAGLLVFFAVEKLSLLHAPYWRGRTGSLHGKTDAPPASAHASWALMSGDSVHNFTDGIMVAGAYVAEPGLGIVTALAVSVHELPKTIGNFVVLLDAGYSRTHAYLCSVISSLAAVCGVALGYFALDHAGRLLPYALAFASSSFLYTAVRHLMPALQRKDTIRESIPQVALIAAGVSLVTLTAH